MIGFLNEEKVEPVHTATSRIPSYSETMQKNRGITSLPIYCYATSTIMEVA